MTTSVSQDSKVIEFNVGGTPFYFAESTLKEPHLKDSVLAMRVNGLWSKSEAPFLDVDPDFFKQWIAPYIRHSVLPDPEKLSSFREKRCLISAANSVGLLALASYAEELVNREYYLKIVLNEEFFRGYRFIGYPKDSTSRGYNYKSKEFRVTSSVKIIDLLKKVITHFEHHLGGAHWQNTKEDEYLKLLEKCVFLYNNEVLEKENTLEIYEIKSDSNLEIFKPS